MIGHRKWLEHSSQTLWCVRRPPFEDLAAREHGRRDATPLVKLGENHRYEVEHDKDHESVERKFMDLDKRPTERTHGLV